MRFLGKKASKLCFTIFTTFFLPLTVFGLTYTDNLNQFNAGFYSPIAASFSDVPPAGIIMPVFEGDEQIYGSISLGNSADPEFHFAVDLFGINENLTSVKFYFDSDKNGDLTDEQIFSATPLTEMKIPTFYIPYDSGENRPYSLNVYIYYDDWDSDYHILHFKDCGWVGKAMIGTQDYDILLVDYTNNGLYDDDDDYWQLSDFICIDFERTGNLQCGYQSNSIIDHYDSFFLDGIAYAANDVSADGTSVNFVEVPVGFLTGRVTSTSTGLSLIGAKIEAWTSYNAKTLTTQGGNFEMKLPIGKYKARASMFGYIPNYYDYININVADTTIWNVDLDPIPDPCSGIVILTNGDSYDFAKRVYGTYWGGDFYIGVYEGDSDFYANNNYQRGILDIGDIGNVALADIYPPDNGYYKYGVPGIMGHTYVSLAQEGEEGGYIAFRVTDTTFDSITLDYHFIMIEDQYKYNFDIDDDVDGADLVTLINLIQAKTANDSNVEDFASRYGS